MTDLYIAAGTNDEVVAAWVVASFIVVALVVMAVFGSFALVKHDRWVKEARDWIERISDHERP
jgi:hypothetical protein